MRALTLLLALAACALAACAQPGRRYVGPLTPDAPSAQCRPATASLVLRDADALFTPDEGTWTLSGPISGATLSASRSTRGATGPYVTRVDARWDGDGATATYVTPRCTFRAAMVPR